MCQGSWLIPPLREYYTSFAENVADSQRRDLCDEIVFDRIAKWSYSNGILNNNDIKCTHNAADEGNMKLAEVDNRARAHE